MNLSKPINGNTGLRLGLNVYPIVISDLKFEGADDMCRCNDLQVTTRM